MAAGVWPISRPIASVRRRLSGCVRPRARRPPDSPIASHCASRWARHSRIGASTPPHGATTSAATRSSTLRAATTRSSRSAMCANRLRCVHRSSSLHVRDAASPIRRRSSLSDYRAPARRSSSRYWRPTRRWRGPWSFTISSASPGRSMTTRPGWPPSHRTSCGGWASAT